MLSGYTTRKGRSDGDVACEDHSEPEWCSRSVSRVDTFFSPTIATKSAQAASMFEPLVSCLMGLVVERGVVESVEGTVVDLVPR